MADLPLLFKKGLKIDVNIYAARSNGTHGWIKWQQGIKTTFDGRCDWLLWPVGSPDIVWGKKKKQQEQKLHEQHFFGVWETAYAVDSVIIHRYCVKNLIHRFDGSNYLWQAALLSRPETWTRSCLAVQFRFPLTPVALLDRYGRWQWSNFIWFAHDTLHTLCAAQSPLLARGQK